MGSSVLIFVLVTTVTLANTELTSMSAGGQVYYPYQATGQSDGHQESVVDTKDNTTDTGPSPASTECPKGTETTMYQTQGPVNIYLHGGTASTHLSGDGTSSTADCTCPPAARGPQGPRGIRGPQGPEGPPSPGHVDIQPSDTNNTTQFVAFFAKMEVEYGPFERYRRVVFDRVLTNIGAAYKQTTGVFTTPVDGVYQFHIHIHTTMKHKAEVKLVVGRVDVVSVWADSEMTSQRSQDGHEMGSSNSLLLHLKQGQMVYCVLPSKQVLAGLGFTTFSGQLLRTDHQIGYQPPTRSPTRYTDQTLPLGN